MACCCCWGGSACEGVSGRSFPCPRRDGPSGVSFLLGEGVLEREEDERDDERDLEDLELRELEGDDERELREELREWCFLGGRRGE